MAHAEVEYLSGPDLAIKFARAANVLIRKK